MLRMKESRVLVLNMTGAITELCRHLVLSGINLELADDKVLVESTMAQSEFMINPDEDAGKPVSEAFSTFFIEGSGTCSETQRDEPLRSGSSQPR
jgi:molybdopterin/thiamine biosynthesis adenylyltransferase